MKIKVIVCLLLCIDLTKLHGLLITSNLKLTTTKAKKTNLFSKQVTPQNTVNTLLGLQQMATQGATNAASASASASSSCQANVNCNNAQTQVVTASSYQKTVSSATATTQSSYNSISDIYSLLQANALSSGVDPNTDPNCIQAKNTLALAGLALQNTQVAAQATASAVSSCNLIVFVICNGCPNGPGANWSLPPIFS